MRASSRLGLALALGLAAAAGLARPVRAGAYAGPLIDAHAHLPSASAIEPYVAAMRRHGVTRVLLLGVGGRQPADARWIDAAARRYPDGVLAGLPLPDPTDPAAATRVDAALARGAYRAVGEIHLRQIGRRRIERDPTAPAFGAILDAAARRRVPVVVHYELTDAAAAALERALAAHRAATLVLAHGGEGPPARLAGLLERNPNLLIDLSGLHFERRPALATERGPLDPAWKALIERFPDRFLAGVDVWAPRLFEPTTLDRLLSWTRRILGELAPDVAARVAYRNAAALLGLER